MICLGSLSERTVSYNESKMNAETRKQDFLGQRYAQQIAQNINVNFIKTKNKQND